MKDRIKKIRRELDLTQQKFADRLGVKRNTVAQWELGINALTDQIIVSICREFNVNEEWLRDGTGPMFIERSRDEQIASETDIINILISLTAEDWKLLIQTAQTLIKHRKEVINK